MRKISLAFNQPCTKLTMVITDNNIESNVISQKLTKNPEKKIQFYCQIKDRYSLNFIQQLIWL